MLRTSLQQMAYRGGGHEDSTFDVTVKYTFFTRWYRWTVKPFWKKISLSNWIMKPAGRWVLKTKICETTINLRVLHIKSGPNATWRPPRHAFLSRNQRFNSSDPWNRYLAASHSRACFSILLKVLGGKKRFPKWPNGGEQLWVPMVLNKHHCLKMNFSFCPKWDMLVPWRVTWHPDLCNVQKHYPKETLGAKIQTGSSCELQAHWMIPFVQSQKSRDFPLFKGKNIHSRRGWKLSYHQHQSYHTQ